jgi:SAM-dependent methyltransferase
MYDCIMSAAQTWDLAKYAQHARFVFDLGSPVVELLDPHPDKRILDLGCGDGVLTKKLADLGCEVVAIDSSAPQVEAAKKPNRKEKRRSAKSILRLPDLEAAKSAVLNSLSCPDAQRGYRHAIDELVEWYCSEPRLSFSKTVVVRYRMHLESRRLAPGTINLRLGAVRRLA